MVEALKTVGVVAAACLVGIAAAGVVNEYLDYGQHVGKGAGQALFLSLAVY